MSQNQSIANQLEFVAAFEAKLNLDLNQQTIIDVPCDCGEYHPNVVAMTADEKREANRNRVAWQTNVATYLVTEGQDAWKIRTLNLDSLLSRGLI